MDGWDGGEINRNFNLGEAVFDQRKKRYDCGAGLYRADDEDSLQEVKDWRSVTCSVIKY